MVALQQRLGKQAAARHTAPRVVQPQLLQAEAGGGAQQGHQALHTWMQEKELFPLYTSVLMPSMLPPTKYPSPPPPFRALGHLSVPSFYQGNYVPTVLHSLLRIKLKKLRVRIPSQFFVPLSKKHLKFLNFGNGIFDNVFSNYEKSDNSTTKISLSTYLKVKNLCQRRLGTGTVYKKAYADKDFTTKKANIPI